MLYNLTLSNHYRFLVQTIFSARKCHGSALSSAAHFWVSSCCVGPSQQSSMASHTGTLFLSPTPGFWTRLPYLYNHASYTQTWESLNIPVLLHLAGKSACSTRRRHRAQGRYPGFPTGYLTPRTRRPQEVLWQPAGQPGTRSFFFVWIEAADGGIDHLEGRGFQ